MQGTPLRRKPGITHFSAIVTGNPLVSDTGPHHEWTIRPESSKASSRSPLKLHFKIKNTTHTHTQFGRFWWKYPQIYLNNFPKLNSNTVFLLHVSTNLDISLNKRWKPSSASRNKISLKTISNVPVSTATKSERNRKRPFQDISALTVKYKNMEVVDGHCCSSLCAPMEHCCFTCVLCSPDR